MNSDGPVSGRRCFSARVAMLAALLTVALFSTELTAQDALPRVSEYVNRADAWASELDRRINTLQPVLTADSSARGYVGPDHRLIKAVTVLQGEGLSGTRAIYFRGGDPFLIRDQWSGPGDTEPSRARYYFRDGHLLAHANSAEEEAVPSDVREGEVAGDELLAEAFDLRSRMEPSSFERAVLGMGGWVGFLLTAIIGIIIVGMFVLLGRQYLWPLRRTARAMRNAKGRVTGVRDDPGTVFPDGPQRLQDLWEGFLRDRDDTTHPYNNRDISTLDPAEVFYDDAVLSGYNRNFAGTLAGFFTGLGILGTFAGLVLGLSRLDVSQDGMLDSVGGLLGGMSTAFYTSLIGIFFSLIWLVLDRVLLHRVQKATNEFLHTVRNKYPVESPDRLLHHLLNVEESENAAIHESRDLLTEQKGILQSLSVDLAVAFEEAVTQSLENSLAPKLEKMNEALESLSVQFGDRQAEALGEMTAQFQDRLSETLHGHLEGLAGSIAKAAEWQEVVHGELHGLTDRLSEASGRQTDLVEATNSAASTFANSIGALAEANGEIRDSLDALERTSTGVQSLAEGMQEQADLLEGRIAEVGRENEVYREANENIRTQLARQIETLDQKLTDLDDFWDELTEGLDEASRKLQSGATEFSSLTTQKLNEIFNRFDSEMATVVEHLAGTLAEIREVTDDLPRNLSGFGEELTSHAERLAEGGERLEHTVERLQVLEGIAESLSRLEPMREGLGEVAEKMGGAGRSLDELLGHVQTVDGRFKSFVEEVLNGREHSDGARSPDARQGEGKPGAPADRRGRQ